MTFYATDSAYEPLSKSLNDFKTSQANLEHKQLMNEQLKAEIDTAKKASINQEDFNNRYKAIVDNYQKDQEIGKTADQVSQATQAPKGFNEQPQQAQQPAGATAPMGGAPMPNWAPQGVPGGQQQPAAQPQQGTGVPNTPMGGMQTPPPPQIGQEGQGQQPQQDAGQGQPQQQGGQPGQDSKEKTPSEYFDENITHLKELTKRKAMLGEMAKAAADTNNPALAQKYLDAQIGINDKIQEGKEKALQWKHDIQEEIGRHANSYLENPGSKEWHDFIVNMAPLGIPNAGDLLKVTDPEQRKKIAKELVSQATSVKDQTAFEIKQQAAERKASMDQKKDEYNTWRRGFKEKEQSDRQARDQDKKDLNERKVAYAEAKDALEHIQKRITQGQSDMRALEGQRNSILKEQQNLNNDYTIDRDSKKTRLQEIDNSLAEVDDLILEKRKDIAEDESTYRTFSTPKKIPSGTSPTPPAAKPTGGSVTYESLPPDQKSWVDANVQGNPGMSKEEIIAEGIKRGKITKASPTKPPAKAKVASKYNPLDVFTF